jgi:hypothetical protein
MLEHKQGSHAPVRGSVRAVAAVALMVGALLMASVAPARADTAECALAVERLAQWMSDEERLGLTAGMLEDLQEISALVTGCAGSGLAIRPAPGSGEGDVASYLGGGQEVESWRPLTALYFDPDHVDRVMCLMAAESGGDPDARNPESGAAGLMQVMPFWAEVFGYATDELLRPDINLWVASQILDQQGWTAWSPYQRGLCH